MDLVMIIVFKLYSIMFVFFFFSSRRRHTRCYRDWSSDVCSSDLIKPVILEQEEFPRFHIGESMTGEAAQLVRRLGLEQIGKRRVGKECRCRWLPDHCKKKENKEESKRIEEQLV